jgi:hypothetical protein
MRKTLPAIVLLALCAAATPATQPAATPRYFAIEVVDDATGRGVPLVELKTVSNVRYYTDSAGLVAIDDPALMGRRVFFNVFSHGYEFPKDGFGIRGRALEVTPGGVARLQIKRLNIAERLYRVTGEGIYSDSVLLGRPVPIKQPLLNGQVVGQDSVQSVIYRGKIHWFWGDTNRQSYPLGHFGMAGATSPLPGKGGLDPSVGINLEYFVDDEGFSRPTAQHPPGMAAWLDAFTVLRDKDGQERLVARSLLVKGLGEPVGRWLVSFNDESNKFEPLWEIANDAPLQPQGHPVAVKEGGTDYIYYGVAFPCIRARADLENFRALQAYEGFTCLAPGTRYRKDGSTLDRAGDGKLVWGWKRDTAVLTDDQQDELVKAGKLKPDERWFRPRDVETGKPVLLKGGSVSYNAFRKRWVMVAMQGLGGPSFLGETWYSEADKPEGPWPWARKILTHDRYSFYNPRQHPFFDQEGGRVIFFEGTYASTFSRKEDPTPRYDYNQIMYRLDLSDPRLKLEPKD